ncbi:neutral/alkaline non-lysosomal ceramidase N-terminal domain-containing protein [Enterococcus hulanensis]|uniref:neutral/alkaline non-lysosomal ceramidase N-terminal domain-containing protein n=1 Tax=Enterococcus hulanensis TaxID=2559929 RepID=UPI001A934611|nr:neutral/alkaline non-lysosomal ceramidase N-terminal domain-containing protein [Enterococcus hulanensis]MBO0413538.1 neutral/alkaline non-lysosomal ceramidase N-terminal domain-containing protein [Enterococcus hulanensis]
MPYLLGYNQEIITPESPMLMSGYSPLRHNIGCHDPLFVKTHCFYNETTKELFILVTLDLLAVDNTLKVFVETELLKELGSKVSTLHLFLCATHTHSGPIGTLDTRTSLKNPLSTIFGEFNQSYIDFLKIKIVESIKKAFFKVSPFLYRVKRTSIDTIGRNRNDQNQDCDFDIFLIEFSKKFEKTLLVNYSCHPTVLDGENQLFSSDFLNSLYKTLEDEYEGVQFLNGSCGNISTRFTKSEASFEQADIFGRLLAAQVKNALSCKWKELKSISVFDDFYTATAKKKEENQVMSHKFTETKQNHFNEGNSNLLSRLENNILETIKAKSIVEASLKNITSLKIPFSIIKFDDYLFLTLPGEITSELTKELRQNHKLKVIGLCNDYLFYFAPKDYFEMNTYEANSSFLEKGEAEKLIQYITCKVENL